MLWLVSLPVWVLIFHVLFPTGTKNKRNTRLFMIFCSLALIFVLGLRSRYTGTADTFQYTLVFSSAAEYNNLHEYLLQVKAFDGFFLLSEGGFSVYTWLAAQIFPEAQWFLLLTAVVTVFCTARFISKNSEDPLISWITFICLGSMTFAMNGMRQALAMSICLLSYRYAREKKFIRFLLVVLLATLFHKSAMIFLLVYFLRNLRLNWQSLGLLVAIVAILLVSANSFASLYDSLTGEDYAAGESFESGGIIVIAIYAIAIMGMLLFSKRLKEPQVFFPFALITIGFSLYLIRFLSTQMYERISYYFAYFLMLAFPLTFADMEKKTRSIVRICFVIASIMLFAYRIGKGAFADFAMFWQE